MISKPTLKHRIQFIQEGSAVTRFHTRPTLRTETDGQHQHMVAMLCILLSPNEQPSVELLKAALTHDLAEQVTSDVSAPAKRLLGLREQLGDVEDQVLDFFVLCFEDELFDDDKRTLKLADAMAGMLWCCSEIALGNKNAILMYTKFSKYAFELLDDGFKENEDEVYSAIQSIWRESSGADNLPLGIGGPEFNCHDFDYFEDGRLE